MSNDLDEKHCEAIEKEIQATYEVIRKLEQEPQQANSPEAMEELERTLREATGNLSAVLLQKHLQASLDSPESQARERDWMVSCAGYFKNEGRVEVWVRTLGGLFILVRATLIVAPVTAARGSATAVIMQVYCCWAYMNAVRPF